MQTGTRAVSPVPQWAIGRRFGVLDAWRGVCALLVTIVHIPVAHRFQDTVGFLNMQMFVDFFFVLSGFVMCHAYGQGLKDERAFEGFMIRRFGRIYPLHLVMIAGFVALEMIKLGAATVMGMSMEGEPFTGPRSLDSLLTNLLLLQSFNLHGMTTWNGPAWSIGVEFYAYIVFAGAVLLAGMRTALFAALAVVGLAGVVAFSPEYIFTTHDYGFLRCLYGFFVGCLVYQAVMRPGAGKLAGTALETASILLLAGFMVVAGKTPVSLAAPIVFAVVVYVFAFEKGIVSRLLETTPAQALGLWSYSIYMVHMLIFAAGKMMFALIAKKGLLGFAIVTTPTAKLWTFNSTILDGALFAAMIVITLIASKLTYDWIEDPWRRRFAALARRHEGEARSQATLAPARRAAPQTLRIARGLGTR